MSPHLRFSGAAQIFALTALACSSSLEPRAGVTLHVLNGTCTPGPCMALEILGFPSNQPHTPGGSWWLNLGTMIGPEVCVVIPDTARFLVIGPNADTTKYVWTNAMALTLGAEVPEFLPPSAAPTTPSFVPALSSGWQITLPGQIRVNASADCKP